MISCYDFVFLWNVHVYEYAVVLIFCFELLFDSLESFYLFCKVFVWLASLNYDLRHSPDTKI